MYNRALAENIYNYIDQLNGRGSWSIYQMEDLILYINTVHNHLETLIEWHDNDEYIATDEYNKVVQYVEIASNLERALDIAIVKLRCGDDVCIDYEY